MLQSLSYQKKRLLFLSAAALVLYLCYSFSFKKAFDAFLLHRDLQKHLPAESISAGNNEQLNRKDVFYASVLQAYKVKKEGYDSHLWQAISELSIQQQVKVDYTVAPIEVLDSVQLQQGIVKREFSFKDGYFSLVKLLDTLGKSKGIGCISGIELTSKKAGGDDKSEGLTLKLELIGIDH